MTRPELLVFCQHELPRRADLAFPGGRSIHAGVAGRTQGPAHPRVSPLLRLRHWDTIAARMQEHMDRALDPTAAPAGAARAAS